MARRIATSFWMSSLLLSSVSAFAQTIPDTTIAAALGNLNARAGVVFAGQVTAIRPIGGVVEVDFQVEQNLKAASAGTYTLREWAGLWSAGQRRYWLGERALVFLNPSGKSGLSSAVDGMEGILPLTADANNLIVDVQRLRARVQRDAGAPMIDSAPQISLVQVVAVVNPQPVAAPGVPILKPVLPPVFHPITLPVPNPVFQRLQNAPILVMDPALTDDLLSTDDDDVAHKKSQPANATR